MSFFWKCHYNVAANFNGFLPVSDIRNLEKCCKKEKELLDINFLKIVKLDTYLFCHSCQSGEKWLLTLSTVKPFSCLLKVCKTILNIIIFIQSVHLFLLSNVGKTAHQLWCDHPFKKRNKTTEWALEVGFGANRKGEVGQNLKKRGRQYMGRGL